ncbi:MAG: electron transport complex subunit RsxA [Clostridiales bacterium]|jgi:electron transport complex protein RnfA|nr:electron transport complex subunit RsxA [Clostridiales bacterium]
MNLMAIFLGGIFVNNFVMAKFLGTCPFLGVSKKIETAVGMGIAVTFVMALASAVTYLVFYYILVPLNITYLYNIAFILVIAALVQLVEIFIKKSSPPLYQALGIYLPLITTNCAVLGVTVLNKTEGYNFLEAVVNGVAGGLGFMLVIVLLAGIRERIEYADIPAVFRGFPEALLSAGLMAIAFLGFTGLIG